MMEKTYIETFSVRPTDCDMYGRMRPDALFTAMQEGGVQLGSYPKDALNIVAQTMEGALKLLETNGSHPEQEIDKVTTPGGLTIKGLNTMEQAGFTNAVIQGLTRNS